MLHGADWTREPPSYWRKKTPWFLASLLLVVAAAPLALGLAALYWWR